MGNQDKNKSQIIHISYFIGALTNIIHGAFTQIIIAPSVKIADIMAERYHSHILII